MKKGQITLERTFQAPIEDVWELWTTKAGIESWWGPEGFSVEVRELDLRPGSQLVYVMTATEAPQIAFMKKAGLPLTNENRLTYDEIVKHERLAYTQVADFVPGVAASDVETVVELHASAQGVRMMLTFDAMHDEHWTKMAKQGHESELDKLERVLANRKT
jgi:uncharacterized protein YndB with AHSA1/START domain